MSSRSSLLLRSDASALAGTGHVMRALALAQAWMDAGGTATLATTGIPSGIASRLEGEGVEVVPIAATAGSAADADATVELARDRSASWVVADGYHLGRRWQTGVRRGGAGLLCVDDDARIGAYDADLVLDQNLGADARRYGAMAPGARLLLGPRYALLRREFRHWSGAARSRRESPGEARRVLVTLGGSDPERLTERVLRALARPTVPALDLRVVVGTANPRLPALRAMATELAGRHAVTVLAAVTSGMAELMAWADVAVSAAGSTCWELAFLGVPMVLVVAVDNQRAIAEGLMAEGAAMSLGEASALDEAALAEAVVCLLRSPASREALAARARRAVDGRGAERVASALALVPA